MGGLTGLVRFTDKSCVYCKAHTHGERGDCEAYRFEVAKCETEWCDTSPHGKKKNLRATVIICSRYVQIDTSIPEKVIAETWEP